MIMQLYPSFNIVSKRFIHRFFFNPYRFLSSIESFNSSLILKDTSSSLMENVVLNGNSTLQTASTIENEQIKSFDSDKDETTVMEKSVQFVNYHIRAAMLLQRNPIIMKAQTPFEASYEEYRELYQFQTSRGVLQFQNSGNEDKRGEGNNEEGSNSSFNENNRKSSASMMVNKNDNEISNNPFGTNSEKTMEIQKLFNDHKEYYDNHDKNTKSLKRKLDRKLYLMIKDEINGEPGRWILPFHTLTNESIPIHMVNFL